MARGAQPLTGAGSTGQTLVLDASVVVSAALKPNSPPERALLAAVTGSNQLVLSRAIEDEYRQVIFRPKFDQYLSVARRQWVLDIVTSTAARFEPTVPVTDCRDPNDNKYLELALASAAEITVSSDNDLLVPNPWRGVRILTPAAYVRQA